MSDRAGVIGRADVLWRRVGQSVLIRVRGHDESIRLTGSGVAVWGLLADPTDRDTLFDRLAAEHGADRGTVAADLEPVVADLIRRKAVREH